MAEKKIDMSLEAIIKLDKKKNKGTASTTINKTFRRGSVKLVRGRNRGSQVPKKKQQNDARGGRSRRNWTVSVKTQKQSGNRPRPRPGKPNMQQQQKNVNIGISRINSRKSLKSRNGSQGRLKTLRSDYLVENVSKNTQKRANPQRLLNSSVKGILSKKNRNRKTETNLFTKNFDARKKITSKKEQKQGVQGIRAMTKVLFR